MGDKEPMRRESDPMRNVAVAVGTIEHDGQVYRIFQSNNGEDYAEPIGNLADLLDAGGHDE